VFGSDVYERVAVGQAKAMRTSHTSDLVRRAFSAHESDDRDLIEALLSED
jgi:hypothetical protein